MTKKTFHIVTRTDVLRSIETLSPYEKVEIDIAKFATHSSIVSAIFRLNRKYGYKEFDIESFDNYTKVVITRCCDKEQKTDN